MFYTGNTDVFMNVASGFGWGLGAVLLIMFAGCKESHREKIKYPKDFPAECIEYFDRWGVYLKKMENSKRFDAETMTAFKAHRDTVFSIVAEGRRFFTTPERKKNYCLLNERSTEVFDPLDNMDNLTQAELEEAMNVEYIKQRHRERRHKP